MSDEVAKVEGDSNSLLKQAPKEEEGEHGGRIGREIVPDVLRNEHRLITCNRP